MSAVNATPENLNQILSGEDIAPASKAPVAAAPARRTPYFETESGKRLIEGTANLFRNAIPPLLGMLLFVGDVGAGGQQRQDDSRPRRNLGCRSDAVFRPVL